MAVNKRKVLDAARKFAQKGAKQKALKEYNTLLKLDPRDAKLHLEIGDTYRRWGQLDEAIAQYTRVAEQYQQEGFDARAVAVFKQILNLDPKRYATFVSLSELYQHMGLDAEAIGALQTAADGYHKEGKRREALDLLRRMAALDPTNTTSRMKVADLLRQEDLPDEAVVEYEGVAEELLRNGAIDSLASVYERILEIQPERVDVLVSISRNLIELKDPDRAEPFARRALSKAPDAPEHYELLSDVYKALGRVEDLIDVTRSLAKLHRERGDEERAREVIQRLPAGEGLDVGEPEEVELEDPVDERAFGDQFDLSDAGDAGEDLEVSDDDLLDDDEFFESGEDAGELDLDAEVEPGSDEDIEPLIEVPADSPALAASSAEPMEEEELPEGDSDQLLAEASVYLRYGKTKQAITSLRAVVAREPGHRGALEKLGEAHAEGGDPERAVEVWISAVERAAEDGDSAGVAVLRDRIAALDPAAAARIEVPADAEEVELDLEAPDLDSDLDDFELSGEGPDEASEQAGAEDVAAVSDDFGSDEIDIEIDASDFGDNDLSEGDSEFEVEVDLEDEVAASSDEEAADESLEAAGAQTQPSLVGDDLSFDDSSVDDESALDTQAGPEIALDEPSEDLHELEIEAPELDLAGDASEESSEAVDDPDEATFDAGLPEAPDPSSSESSSASSAKQIADDLEEGEFYFQQGLYDEAEEVYQRILEAVPNHPSAMLRMGELAEARGEDPSEVHASSDLASEPETDEIGVEIETASEDVPADSELEFDGDPEVEDSEVPEELEPPLVAEESELADEDDPDSSTDQMMSVETPDSSATDDEGETLAAATDDENETLAAATDDENETLAAATDDEGETLAAATDDEGETLAAATDDEGETLAAATDDDDETLAVATGGAESDEATAEASDDQTLPMNEAPQDEEADCFDFAAELRDELEEDDERAESSSEAAGSTADIAFESVFNDFKKGVSEQLSDGDFETRYDLGIAYREMELYDDAIAEFSHCLSSPERQLDSLCMMALCAIDLDRGDDAVSHLEQALAMPELEETRRAGIQFDLGRAFKSLDDLDRARGAFEAVLAFDASFPGAREALDSLDSADPDAGDDSFEERGESFDDLIAEAEADDDEPEAPVAEAGEVFESFDDLVTDDPDFEPTGSAPAPAAEPEAGASSESGNKKTARRKKKISFV